MYVGAVISSGSGSSTSTKSVIVIARNKKK
jgi:hypothetical protein